MVKSKTEQRVGVFSQLKITPTILKKQANSAGVDRVFLSAWTRIFVCFGRIKISEAEMPLVLKFEGTVVL